MLRNARLLGSCRNRENVMCKPPVTTCTLIVICTAPLLWPLSLPRLYTANHICWAHTRILFGTVRNIHHSVQDLTCIPYQPNVPKSVWNLARLEWSDVVKTDWWLHIVTDIAECIETFKFRIWSHNKLQFLPTGLHSQTNLLFTVRVRRIW